jgi:hypothetical protein
VGASAASFCAEPGEVNDLRRRRNRGIDVRDSTNIRGAVLTFSSTQWNTFVAGLRSDE